MKGKRTFEERCLRRRGERGSGRTGGWFRVRPGVRRAQAVADVVSAGDRRRSGRHQLDQGVHPEKLTDERTFIE
jgi:hypothetical protein